MRDTWSPECAARSQTAPNYWTMHRNIYIVPNQKYSVPFDSYGRNGGFSALKRFVALKLSRYSSLMGLNRSASLKELGALKFSIMNSFWALNFQIWVDIISVKNNNKNFNKLQAMLFDKNNLAVRENNSASEFNKKFVWTLFFVGLLCLIFHCNI